MSLRFKLVRCGSAQDAGQSQLQGFPANKDSTTDRLQVQNDACIQCCTSRYPYRYLADVCLSASQCSGGVGDAPAAYRPPREGLELFLSCLHSVCVFSPGRMTVRLAVAGAFHTQYMAPAVERLQQALANTPIQTPRIPVISNVDAAPHSDPDTIRAILAKQVRGNTLRWFEHT